MIRFIQIAIGILVVQAMILVGLSISPAFSKSPAPVEIQKMQSKLIAERDNSIQSSQLTGKYKMRLGESIFQPNGYVGKHHHSGPGIRYVTMGEITSVSAGKPAVYKAGESFYDSGEVVHELYNRTNGTVRVLNFEMLPSDWKGSSTIPIDK